MGTLRNKYKIISLLLFLAQIATFYRPLDVFSATKDELVQQKIQKQQLLNQLNQQIKDLQGQIKSTQAQTATLQNEINLYNIEIQTTQLQIQATQTNIDNTNIQITETKQQIQDKNTQIDSEKKVLTQLIGNLNQYDNTSELQLGLSSSNFSDLMDQVQYTESLQSKVFSILQQIKDLKLKLQDDQLALQQNLDQLTKLDNQLNQSETSLADEKSSKEQLLTETKGKESRYQKLLSTTQSQEDQINKEIYSLDNQISGRKNFKRLPVNHGLLAWPMDGILTQGYGNTGFQKLGYNFHNGIDIAAPPGTSIYSAADGVVVGSGHGQAAYGNWVAIKHTIQGHGIVTLYAHMTSFVVSGGQHLKQGDLVGYEGNTGNTTRLLYGPDRGYHLHFSVFDADGFNIKQGAYSATYGPYLIPYGYTYDPRDFL